ncbi:23344_t:CDS:2 [Dentiscutata erythropus]|uniref:23344_t:CDS:1 n=1 Tax=Dentiscutata erythropus TaxID=1348616 RepID=A0A9N9EHR7_9GLOM|nr:23344_t:CDS:2 [Dentiscutata erythropus]
MHHPGELCNLRLKDINKTVKEVFVNKTSNFEDKPLFLSRQEKQLIVGAVGAIVKRIARHASLCGRFTAYSIRIGDATTAIEAGTDSCYRGMGQ